jgi:AcrR family transcriptional regulator
MPQNSQKKQSLTRRAPKQGRAQEKIELILEAATRIIDKDGLQSLTTNRIAELAGISIGTLYQYFGSKAAILEVLGQREMKTVNENIIATLSNSNSGESQEPARILIDCVFGAFGGRSRVHRELLEYAWQMGHANNIDASSKLIAN